MPQTRFRHYWRVLTKRSNSAIAYLIAFDETECRKKLKSARFWMRLPADALAARTASTNRSTLLTTRQRVDILIADTRNQGCPQDYLAKILRKTYGTGRGLPLRQIHHKQATAGRSAAAACFCHICREVQGSAEICWAVIYF